MKSIPILSHSIRIGCAGWSIPKVHGGLFPTEGTHLARYAARFPAVEINSSFYRPHRPATYVKWAESVSKDFLFAVKMPKQITHERRLEDTNDLLDRFLLEAGQLGVKQGPLLVQLPPSLTFSATVAKKFMTALRNRFQGSIALEPRHPSWFEASANALAIQFRVAVVAADPAIIAAAAEPRGWDGFAYYRLHGSPQVYYSTYPAEYLSALAQTLLKKARAAEVWCIFDNTAEGSATANAIDLLSRVREE